MRFFLTSTAKTSLENIIEFLRIKWTEKEILLLKNDIINFKETINDGIIKHQFLHKNSNIQFALISNKQVKIYFEILNEDVIIKLFWHCKQNPKNLRKLLK